MQSSSGFFSETPSERQNIIFVDITPVLHMEGSASSHNERVRTGAVKNIKNHPTIQARMREFLQKADETNKAAARELVASLHNEDLSIMLDCSKEAVRQLILLCKENNAKIVVSNGLSKGVTAEQAKAVFSVAGLDEYVFDVARGNVLYWLENHSSEINSYVILSTTEDKSFHTRMIADRKLESEQLTETHVQAASEILKKSAANEFLVAGSQLEAMKANAPHVTEVTFDIASLMALKIKMNRNKYNVIYSLFAALDKNQPITHLTLKDLYQFSDCEHDYGETVIGGKPIQRIVRALTRNTMQLTYLDLSHNNICNVTELLTLITEKAYQLTHLILHHNPMRGEAQRELASWMEKQTSDITIGLDLSTERTGLDPAILTAAAKNPHIHLVTGKKFSPRTSDAYGFHKISLPDYMQVHEDLITLLSSQRLTFINPLDDPAPRPGPSICAAR